MISAACRCGELAEYRSGWLCGVPNSRRHRAGESVVPNIWSSAHRLAWLTMAQNRSVCPAIQLAMYPPNEPPIMPVRVSSMSGRACAASVIAIRSVNGRLPQSACPRAMKSRPYPVDSAGSGSSTAYPRAAISHGFHRQDQVFQLDSGPPCTHSSSGAGASAAAAAGSTSQARSAAPSLAVVAISVSQPGSRRRAGRAGQPVRLSRLAGVQPHGCGRAAHGRPQRVYRTPVRGRAQAGIRTVVGGQPGDAGWPATRRADLGAEHRRGGHGRRR